MNSKGGLAKGKSHREGGIKATVKSTGQNIEFEGGEIIINKKNVADPTKLEFEGEKKTTCEILSDLNSRNNNGVTMDCDSVEGKKYKYAKGGRITYVPNERVIRVYGDDGTIMRAFGNVSRKEATMNHPALKRWLNSAQNYAYLRDSDIQIEQYAKGGKLQQGEQVFFAIYQDGRRLDDTPLPSFDNEVVYPNGNRSQWFRVQRRFSDAVESMKNLFQDMELYGYVELSEMPTSTWEIKKITLSTQEDKYGDYNHKEKSMFKIKSSEAEKLIKEDKFGNGGRLDNVTEDISELLKRKGGNIDAYTLDEKVLLSKYNPEGTFPSDRQALMMWQLAMKYSGKIDINNCIIPNSCGADKLISQAPIDLKHIDVFSMTKKDYLINDIIYGKNFLSENNRIKLYESDNEYFKKADFNKSFINHSSRFKFGADCIITNMNDVDRRDFILAEDMLFRAIDLAGYLKTNGVLVSAYPLENTISDTVVMSRKNDSTKDYFLRTFEIVKVVQLNKDGFPFLNESIEIIILKKR